MIAHDDREKKDGRELVLLDRRPGLVYNTFYHRGVAQSGSAQRSGRWGRGFKSHLPDSNFLMLIRDLQKCRRVISGDKAILREFFHPDKARVEIRYSLAHAVVKRGKKTLPHRLSTSEVYYVLAGRGVMHVGDKTNKVRPGQAVYVPPGSVQFIENTGRSDLVFLCIVDPAWQPEDEEVT
jgi:mannose-6-phosphate isomerase-like protein (cupin superfamily)